MKSKLVYNYWQQEVFPSFWFEQKVERSTKKHKPYSSHREKREEKSEEDYEKCYADKSDTHISTPKKQDLERTIDY